MWNSVGISTTRSGLPICQPSVNAGNGGSCDGSPWRASASTHLTIVSICACVRLRSFLNAPCEGSANHGGIVRELTLSRIARAHGRTSLNVMSDIGATSPGRWQVMHLLYRIGATSLLNVGAFCVGGTRVSCAETVSTRDK